MQPFVNIKVRAFVVAVALFAHNCPVYAQGEEPSIKMRLMSKGLNEKLDFYYPRQVALSNIRPSGLRSVIPFESPLFGSIEFGGKSHLIVLDESDSKPPTLYAETHSGSGEVAQAIWHKDDKSKMSTGSFELAPDWNGDHDVCTFKAYRFDKSDPARQSVKFTLLYYSDYALEGTITLGRTTFHAMMIDELAAGDFRATTQRGPGPRLLIDLNGDGKYLSNEIFEVNQPFNVQGTTWEIVHLKQNGDFSLRPSDRSVAPLPTPDPPLGVGKQAPPFKGKATDGSIINCPGDFKGKVILLDFWATWCGPCLAEVPTLVEVDQELGPRGVVVIGVSLDNLDALVQMKRVTAEKKMTWRQIFDGKGWNAEIAQQFKIKSIPASFLIDGDSGEVLAAGDSVRGDKLRQTVLQALAKKATSQDKKR